MAYSFGKTSRRVVLLSAVWILGGASSSAAREGLLEGWKGSVFAGYNKTGGNTDKGSGTLDATAQKSFGEAELLLKGHVFYSESDQRMDGQKWNTLAKLSFDFGEEDAWFSYYQVYVDHDYFADIDYRIAPGAGLGYHLARTEDWTWDADAGLGWRVTRHRVAVGEDDEVVTVQGHTFAKRRIFEKSFISEDLTLSPGLEAGAGFLMRSETAFTNPVSEAMDLEVKYIVDYDSEPATDKKRTDTQFIVGMKYRF